MRLAPHLHLVSFNLGTLLVRLARYREAIAAFERAAEGRPDYDDAYENLGRLYYRFNEIDKAHATYLKWLQMAPEHPVALHMAAAAAPADAPPPARATDEYVRRAFDEFAHGFDESLAGLGYRAPQLVTTAPGCQPEALRTAPAILDAGCGTGLCGPLLRPLASRLDGVDLSEKMVELAAERGGYDELIVGELCEVLRSRPRTYDAIVSADTLVYFGDLAEPLAAAAGCLRPAAGSCSRSKCSERRTPRQASGLHRAGVTSTPVSTWGGRCRRPVSRSFRCSRSRCAWSESKRCPAGWSALGCGPEPASSAYCAGRRPVQSR